MEKAKYSLYDFIELRYSDPINSIALSNNILIIGTMMGKASLYMINSKQKREIVDMSNEAITATSIDLANNNFYFSIGDEEVYEFINDKGNFQYPESTRYKNYANEEMHQNQCDTCYTMLDNNHYLILFFEEPYNNESPITSYECNYQMYIYREEREKLTGKIELSKYTVPFEFVRNKYSCVEHSEDNSRLISVYDFSTNTKSQNTIDNNIGHVSFLKSLPNNEYIIVYNYSILAIFDNSLKELAHTEYTKGDIESIDYYENNNKEIVLVVLDNEGNITEYIQKGKTFEVIGSLSLYDMIEIDDEMKQKGLFDMEFPYYLKSTDKYIAITCDYACFIVKRE